MRGRLTVLLPFLYRVSADRQTECSFLVGQLRQELQKGTYQPKPVKRVWIPKPGTQDKRPLGIPAVRDRIVQGAIRNVIEPIFEREFAEHSYGFRPGRGCKDALRRVDGLLHQAKTDRKSTRLNSSHQIISYAVFCLKKKKKAHN